MMAIIAVLTALTVPAVSKVKQRAYSTHCRGNLSQLGLAVRMYVDDNEGRLPVLTNALQAKNSLVAVLGELVKTPEVFKCRADLGSRGAPVALSYKWNSAFNGRFLPRLEMESNESQDAAGYWLIRDSAPRHGYENAVFSDGHVARRN